MAKPVAAVVLAAGGSRRMGRPKQLLPYRGRSLLAHAVGTVLASQARPVLVVLGANSDDLMKELAGLDVSVVLNSDWAEGMGGSVRRAMSVLDALLPEPGAVLFTVCDQPFVTPNLLDELIHAHTTDGHNVVACDYDGVLGVPALFGRELFGELAELRGDAGAKSVLRRHAGEVLAVPFAGGSIDIDTPADFERLG